MCDIRVTNHGSIVILTGESDEGMNWLNDHLPLDAMRWGGCGFAVEPRYVEAITDGAADDGMELSW
jgi:hypothetical protein